MGSRVLDQALRRVSILSFSPLIFRMLSLVVEPMSFALREEGGEWLALTSMIQLK